MKAEKKYLEVISCQNRNPESEEFLELLSCISRWSGPHQPGKLGTVKLCQAVTLLPRCEHLVLEKRPANVNVSPGSTVIVEPTTSRSAPCHVLVGRVVTPMWGEEKGIISKSLSEYASPLVMAWKKDGSLRVCTDFRWLNAKTIKDAHPLPHQADCLATLGGSLLFSSVDLTSGFYNVPLYE